MNLIQEFQKRAAAAGLTPEQTQAFINSNGLAEKLAEPSPETIFSQLCDAANVEKSAETYAYAEGVLTQASQRGLAPEQALQVTKQALASTFPAKLAAPEKQASASPSEDPVRDAYFAGLFEKAAELGFSPNTVATFLNTIANPATAVLPAAKAVASSIGNRPPPGVGEQLLSWIKNNPETAGAIGGAGIGGIAGGLSGLPGDADPNNPQAGKSHVGRNALMGALAGGGIGAGAGHFAPDMFKRLAA